MINMTVAEILWSINGEIVFCKCNSMFRLIYGVAIDSRTVKSNDLFIPLKGSKYDGHSFLLDAFIAGAAAAVVDKNKWSLYRNVLLEQKIIYDRVIIAVNDPLLALQKLAEIYLRQFKDLIKIAVTGSNGKTTTRNIIASIFSQNYSTYQPRQNYNSEIGVPLAIFEIKKFHRIAVLEFGIDHPGEMEVLSAMVRPDHAVITNVGTAHIGSFKTKEIISREKGKVVKYLKSEGRVFIPESEELLSTERLPLPNKAEVIIFGPKKTAGYEGCEVLGLDGTIIHWEGLQIHFPLIARHNLINALSAISVARSLGVSKHEIKQGLERVSHVSGRSEVIHKRITIFNDSYNANPEAMKATIEFFSKTQAKNRILAVLGSMLELGEESENAHIALSTVIKLSAFSVIFLFGDQIKITAKKLDDKGFGKLVFWTNDFFKLRDEI